MIVSPVMLWLVVSGGYLLAKSEGLDVPTRRSA